MSIPVTSDTGHPIDHILRNMHWFMKTLKLRMKRSDQRFPFKRRKRINTFNTSFDIFYPEKFASKSNVKWIPELVIICGNGLTL